MLKLKWRNSFVYFRLWMRFRVRLPLPPFRSTQSYDRSGWLWTGCEWSECLCLWIPPASLFFALRANGTAQHPEKSRESFAIKCIHSSLESDNSCWLHGYKQNFKNIEFTNSTKDKIEWTFVQTILFELNSTWIEFTNLIKIEWNFVKYYLSI